MPNATVSLVPEHFDLETLPGGYVKLKRMSFGKKLDRAENATEQSMKGQSMKGQSGESTGGEEVEMLMRLLQRRVAELEFRECIVEHNLTDPDDKPLDFRIPATLDHLDPRIGEEISTLISSMNNYEKGMEKPGNSMTASKDTSSSDGGQKLTSTSS